jgi:hypothetical protein
MLTSLLDHYRDFLPLTKSKLGVGHMIAPCVSEEPLKLFFKEIRRITIASCAGEEPRGV